MFELKPLIFKDCSLKREKKNLADLHEIGKFAKIVFLFVHLGFKKRTTDITFSIKKFTFPFINVSKVYKKLITLFRGKN